MTGPEHYKEAERGVKAADKVEGDDIAMRLLAEAQVHATLALAAASAQNIRKNGAVCGRVDDWSDVLGGE